ncbi:MAG TPA: rRNA maturation RNase YbeY, partial [Armatimonadota bacterium]|nr:rRNA maturation RNase YbeY [Armatimonadota bacterium]
MNLRVEVVIRNEQPCPVDESAIERVVCLTLGHAAGERAAECEVSLLLVEPDAIRALNARHRAIDMPTDVLSFPQLDPFTVAPGEILGDVVVCPEITNRQADAAGRRREDELLEVVAHGVLHLVGYDDGTPEGY